MWLLLTTTRVLIVSLSLSLTSLTIAARLVRARAEFCWVRASMLCSALAPDRTVARRGRVGAGEPEAAADRRLPAEQPEQPGGRGARRAGRRAGHRVAALELAGDRLRDLGDGRGVAQGVGQVLGLGLLLLGAGRDPPQPVDDREAGALAGSQRQAVQQLTQGHGLGRPGLGEVQDGAEGDVVEPDRRQRRDVDEPAVPGPLLRRLALDEHRAGVVHLVRGERARRALPGRRAPPGRSRGLLRCERLREQLDGGQVRRPLRQVAHGGDRHRVVQCRRERRRHRDEGADGLGRPDRPGRRRDPGAR